MDLEHPVFGSLEYASDQWEGQVIVPFFAAYDHPPLLLLGDYERPLEDWKKELHQEGLFDLVIQDQAGTGPTPTQERAFVHFQVNQDRICAAVVAAIFQYYQEQYESFELQTFGLSKAAKAAAIETLLPALAGVEGLKRLIRFATLYVLEPETSAQGNNQSQLGFAFSCTWDVEHRLGVLFDRDKVVRVGSSDVAWTALDDF
jgi:hypothetical protein